MLESRNFWQGSCHWEILAAVETNECLTNNGGCWQKGNITACQVREISSYVSPDWFFLKHPSENKNIFFSYRNLSLVMSLFLVGVSWLCFWVDHFVAQDTFRGRICVCPLVEGVQFEGDGYSNCQGNNIAQFMTYLPTCLSTWCHSSSPLFTFLDLPFALPTTTLKKGLIVWNSPMWKQPRDQDAAELTTLDAG